MNRYFLWEDKPAADFADAHLLGNGALGGAVYGGVPYEQILINHDTLWSGSERGKVNPGTRRHFAQARTLVLEGRLREANDLIDDHMLGYWSESYLPLGFLHIDIGNDSDQRSMAQRKRLLNQGEYAYANYRRTLCLSEAVERIEYDQAGKRFTREVFVSHPDDVLVVRLRVAGGMMDFGLSLDSPLRYEQHILPDGVALTGRAPDRVESYQPHLNPMCAYLPEAQSKALRMAAVARVAWTDGQVVPDDFRVYVRGATETVVILAAGTDYRGFRMPRDADAGAVRHDADTRVQAAMGKGFDALLAAHISDYQALYQRFEIDLGGGCEDVPTSERLRTQEKKDDPALAALVVQYSRYLLIASSRPGTQAANLQGIWNPRTQPPWASNYTTNINVQMNYWGAEALGLPECHLPLMELIRECAEAGRDAARQEYGLNGWVLHHNTDLWRMAETAGEDSCWAWWPMGGAWLCGHLWAHYEYTQDLEFLRAAYPILLGAAEFLCGYVVKDADGYYVTAPSTSPENRFLWQGESTVVCKASTMDLAIIRELFAHCRRAGEILGEENPLRARMEEILEHLYPFKIGRYGQLQEWDQDYEELIPGMGHVSQMYGVYPAGVLNHRDTPALFEAARQSLLRRMLHGAGTRGWPGAWSICLNARFGDGLSCQRAVNSMGGGMAASLLTQSSIQIDAVFGWGAGIVEMLVQSHGDELCLLPALAPSWRQGTVRGLRARGGYRVDLRWRDGTLAEVGITAAREGPLDVRYGDRMVRLALQAGQSVRLDGQLEIQ